MEEEFDKRRWDEEKAIEEPNCRDPTTDLQSIPHTQRVFQKTKIKTAMKEKGNKEMHKGQRWKMQSYIFITSQFDKQKHKRGKRGKRQRKKKKSREKYEYPAGELIFAKKYDPTRLISLDSVKLNELENNSEL